MGALVRVAWARNQAEAELIQGLLREEGVPSIVRRAAGFDVPDYLAAGPRDILVEADREMAARHILDAVETYDADEAPRAGEGTPDWVRALAVTLAVLALVLVAAAIYALI